MRIAKDEPKEIRKFLLEHEPDEGEPPEEVDYDWVTSSSLRVGIQRKTIADFITSMITRAEHYPSRLVKQVTFLRENYDIPVLFLVGWRSLTPEGHLRTSGWKSRWFDSAIELQLFSVQRNLGIFRFECPTDNLFVQARHLLLLRRWTEKKENRSLKEISAPQLESYPLDPGLRRALSNLCSFEGIGERGARNLLFKFRSLKNLYRALIEEDRKSLREVEGIGKILSDRMIQLLGREFKDE